MGSLKLLIVEDSQSDIEAYTSAVRVYEKINNKSISSEFAKTLDEALEKVNGSFDGAIVDLKLDKGGDEGNKVVSKIRDNFRIPTIVFTGTPGNVDDDLKGIEIFKKGEKSYQELIDILFSIFETGLTRIMGGRGVIEKTMNDIFWNNILPAVEGWKKHAYTGKPIEQALLRYTVNHLIELLDNNLEYNFPEETYILPPISKSIKVGSIVNQIGGSKSFLVLSPACDLALREGRPKTDRILLAEIEILERSVFKNYVKKLKDESVGMDEERRNASDKLDKLLRNTYSNYYHFLPKTYNFAGGLINFRKINSYKINDFSKNFNEPSIQVSSSFMKDITSRFSTYYSRQGQPDFDFLEIAETIKAHF